MYLNTELEQATAIEERNHEVELASLWFEILRQRSDDDNANNPINEIKELSQWTR